MDLHAQYIKIEGNPNLIVSLLFSLHFLPRRFLSVFSFAVRRFVQHFLNLRRLDSMRGRSYTPSPPRGYGRRGRSPSPRGGGRYGGGRDRDLPTSLLVRNLRHDCRLV
ncbi:Uncharacterized protein Rs2_26258 [Raphanus sativus]|nr:Uncharacterized protein Rs2_26258 [Raphanus sativus]